MSSNKYELNIEEELEKENPEYYEGLKIILNEFQEHLISKGIIVDSNYSSYAKLLNEIRADRDKVFEIGFNIGDSLQNLSRKFNYDGLSPINFAKGMKYLNATNSKSFVFNEKVSELVRKNNELNRSEIATILLDVYNENDFELPMVKLKFFRFLDPKSNLVFYAYIGPPTPK